ncbi:MAG: hypothetical protein PHG23_01575 [Candidatus Pacebacteria bacterium]|nr:hypothetical protein [Candidatus Paceibacterota bacterium]
MEAVIDLARTLFDSVGVVIEDKRTFLILGLVSKPKRNLDLFVSNGKKWGFVGFYRNFNPRVDKIIGLIEKKGFCAKQMRYPDLDIKRMAIKAGIGCRGKNSLVINPDFGPWLRFAVVETNIPLEEAFPEVTDLCGECTKCLEACPVKGLLEPYKITDKTRCLAYLEIGNPTSGPTPRCNKCLICCPIGKISW